MFFVRCRRTRLNCCVTTGYRTTHRWPVEFDHGGVTGDSYFWKGWGMNIFGWVAGAFKWIGGGVATKPVVALGAWLTGFLNGIVPGPARSKLALANFRGRFEMN